jgi:RHS repeat-associated protein
MTAASPGYTFEWDGDSRLTRVNGPSGAVDYTYDAEGYRLKQSFGGTATIYLGDDYEITGGVGTKYVGLGGRLIAKQSGAATPTWLYTDHQGSVIFGLDGSGAEVFSAGYAPYGEPLAAAAGGDARGYTGQRADAYGTLYLHARFADPALGRFLSPDPTIPSRRSVGLNRYAYAQNDPVNRTDIDGLGFWEDAGAQFSGFVKGLTAIPVIGGSLALPLVMLEAAGSGDDEKAAKAVAVQAIVSAAIAVSIVTYGVGAPPAIATAIGLASSFVTAFSISMVNTGGNVDAALAAGATAAATSIAFQVVGAAIGQIVSSLTGATASMAESAAAAAESYNHNDLSNRTFAIDALGIKTKITGPVAPVLNYLTGPGGTDFRAIWKLVWGGMTAGSDTGIALSKSHAIGATTMPQLSRPASLHGYGHAQSHHPAPPPSK